MVLITRLILPVVIVGAGILYASRLVQTSPKMKRQTPPRQARLVEVVPVERGDFPTKITAWGTVIPAREVDLKPQVSGKIVQISPELIPGGIFPAGQSLMKIDPADYELQVKQKESDVAAAQTNLKLEYGNQIIAQQEYELLGDLINDNDKELVLRQPQLLALQSKLQAAQAQLEQAKLDLRRTNITTPFNAIVKDKYVDVGATVAPTTSLVSLTGTDEYWIELLVPVDQLKWIEIPRRNSDEGSAVRIYNPLVWRSGQNRQGRVIRLCSELQTKGRMAKLLVLIKDPLGLSAENGKTEPILVGSFVRAEIEGQIIPSVIKLNREFLRDGENVWLYTANATLEIRPVEVVFGTQDHVLITRGINSDNQVVTTDIAAAVEGMPLSLSRPESDEFEPNDPRDPEPPDKRVE